MKKLVLVCGLGMLLLVLLFAGCAKKEEATAPEKTEPFKVAFIYIGPPGDLGWTHEHDEGRKMAAEYFGDKVVTTYIENIPEGPDAARVMRQYAQQVYDMIFATSFGYMDPM